MPRPAPVTSQTFFSLMLGALPYAGPCRSLGTTSAVVQLSTKPCVGLERESLTMGLLKRDPRPTGSAHRVGMIGKLVVSLYALVTALVLVGLTPCRKRRVSRSSP